MGRKKNIIEVNIHFSFDNAILLLGNVKALINPNE